MNPTNQTERLLATGYEVYEIVRLPRAFNTSRKLTVTPGPFWYLHEGMHVEVVRGPLQGIRGILLRKEKRHRLVLGVRLIQQAAAVEIDVNDVVPV